MSESTDTMVVVDPETKRRKVVPVAEGKKIQAAEAAEREKQIRAEKAAKRKAAAPPAVKDDPAESN